MNVPEVRLYLLGFMGAGKSTVGRELAGKLNWDFRDLDEVIERETGLSIPQIFEQKGEEQFRQIETTILRRTSRLDPPFILATGGGVPVKEENRQILSTTGVSVYLNVEFDVLLERIGTDESRPLVAQTEDTHAELKTLWETRQPYYREADHTIPLGDESPSDAADRLVQEVTSQD